MSVLSASYRCGAGRHFVGSGTSGEAVHAIRVYDLGKYLIRRLLYARRGGTVTTADEEGIRYTGTLEADENEKVVRGFSIIGDTGLPIRRVQKSDRLFAGRRLERKIPRKYEI